MPNSVPSTVPSTTTTAKSLNVYFRPIQRSARFSHTTSIRFCSRWPRVGFAASHVPPDAALGEAQRQCNHPRCREIEQASGSPPLDRPKKIGIDLVRGEAQVPGPDEESDAGVLEERDECVAQRGKDSPKHDWGRDVPGKLKPAHAQRTTRVQVSAIDREDSRAKDLRQVGSGIYRKRHSEGALWGRQQRKDEFASL